MSAWRIAVRLSVIAGLLAPAARAAPPDVARCLSAVEQGQSEQGLGHYQQARLAFSTCSDEACPSTVRNDCIQWLASLLASMPSIVIAARGAGGEDLSEVSVLVDGRLVASSLDGSPIAIDPGKHQIALDASGYVTKRVSILAHVSERNRLLSVDMEKAAAPETNPEPHRAAPQPEPRSPRSAGSTNVPALPIILGSAGVVALGVSAFLWISARSDLSSLESAQCAPSRSCSTADRSSISTRLVAGDVIAGAGLIALGAGVWLWVTRTRAVSVALQPAVAGVILGGRFE